MKIQNVQSCSFSSWYETLRTETFKSEIIPVPAEVIKYLLSDGIVLPRRFPIRSAQNGQYKQRGNTEISSDSEDGIDWDDDDDSEAQIPSFPQFEEKVATAIKKLGGKVFPKLNWSSPRDATWVALNNSLMCQNLGDIFLLLKSSDFITRDLTQPFMFCDDCGEASDVEYDLVLRQWQDISPSGEFRCFVKNRNLIGICQRAMYVHFPHLEKHKDQIIHDIMDFFHEHIRDKFPDDDYVVDVYRAEEGKIKLVDLNPFGRCTDSLLFSWSELKAIGSGRDANSLPEFRHGDNYGVQPSPYQACALPRDIVDLCRGEDVNKLIDVMRLHENVAGSSSDEEYD